MASHAPVVAVSYEFEESEVDRRVVQCYGFCAMQDVLVNPFYMDFGDGQSSIRWGHVLWQFGARVPQPGHPVDSRGLRQLEQLAQMVMHSIARGSAPSRSYGTRTEFRAPNGASRTLIYVFDEFFLDPSDGRLLAYRAGALDEVAQLSMSDVQECPGPSAADLERAIWAADIKARALMHLYPQAISDEARHRLARSMHAELENKVDSVFAACSE